MVRDPGKSGTTELDNIVAFFVLAARDGRQEKSRGATCVAEVYILTRDV